MASLASAASTTFAVVGYAGCSSVMLVINKLAVHFLPAPSFVLLAQVTCSWVAIGLVGTIGWIEVDALEWHKFRAFFPVALAFLACIFANIKTLQYANVETFIVFRASTPLIISPAEWYLFGRELPNARSLMAMLATFAGAMTYVLTDATFVVHGYMWVVVWYAMFSFDQLYIKFAVDTVKMKSNWGRVFYTNLWASIMLAVLSLATEPALLVSVAWSREQNLSLAASCAAGIAMSYFAFLCRTAVSATSFTVIGNVCKILTVVINISIWDKHASPVGLAALFVCLAASAAYQQAPFQKEIQKEKEQELAQRSADNEENKPLGMGDRSEQGTAVEHKRCGDLSRDSVGKVILMLLLFVTSLLAWPWPVRTGEPEIAASPRITGVVNVATNKVSMRPSHGKQRTESVADLAYMKKWCDTLLGAEPPLPQPCWGASELARRHKGYQNFSLSKAAALRVAATDEHGSPISPSEGGQDRWLYHHHFRYLKRPMIYADFGCNDAMHDSNTFFFDQCMHASRRSLCVDAQAARSRTWDRFRSWRTCTPTSACLSDAVRQVVFAVGGGNNPGAMDTRSGVLTDNKSYKSARKDAKAAARLPYATRNMTCTTGAALFSAHRLEHIDLLDLDAEGHEHAILRGIDWGKVTIDIILVEANDARVTDFLHERGYRKLDYQLHRDDIFLRKGFHLLGSSPKPEPCVPNSHDAAAKGRMAQTTSVHGKVAWPTRPLTAERKAYATVLSSDEYVVGLEILLCQLSRVMKVPLPLYVLYDDKVSSSAMRLARSYASTTRLNVQFLQVNNPVSGTRAGLGVRAATYTKLHIWRLPEDQLVYLDVDVLVRVDPYPLFAFTDHHDFAAAGLWRKRQQLAINSGVMSIRPSAAAYAGVLQVARSPNGRGMQATGTEQDAIIAYFEQEERSVTFLPERWNCRFSKDNTHDCALLHACGNPKPWSDILGQKTSVKGQKADYVTSKWELAMWAQALHETVTGRCDAAPA